MICLILKIIACLLIKFASDWLKKKTSSSIIQFISLVVLAVILLAILGVEFGWIDLAIYLIVISLIVDIIKEQINKDEKEV